MKIEVRASDPLREAVDGSRIRLDLPSNATVADALAQLRRAYPGLAEAVTEGGGRESISFYFFVNRKLVKDEDLARCTLREGDTLYILPPAVGG